MPRSGAAELLRYERRAGLLTLAALLMASGELDAFMNRFRNESMQEDSGTRASTFERRRIAASHTVTTGRTELAKRLQEALAAEMQIALLDEFEQEAEMTKDPVCGMELDEKHAAATSKHGGHTYYFCSPQCKTAFDKKPGSYTSSGEHHYH
jgi:Cu+-exporting ATPase